MTKELSSNRRIAKNTVFLYIRMLVTLVVSLYTSRVILKNLGVSDFGIYNVIGGVIVLFSFLSNALKISTQRFISFELGLGKNGNPNRVYCMSLQCLVLISVIIFILAETIGLWFVNSKLNIPADRMEATQWVYQITILTFIVHFFQVPFQATIIAYERMSIYAYIGIIDVVLKLVVAMLISVCPFDKLIVYSALLLLVSSISLFIPALYCKKSIKIGSFHFIKDKELFKRVMGFSGWSMVSGCSVITAQQGGNILLNVYNGVVANGAYGIANQVSGAIYSFVSNFQSAFQPQIVKQYASGEYKSMHLLMDRAAVFSYYLLLLLTIPFCVAADYVLQLWLGQVPEYAAGFIVLMLLYSLIDAIEAPLWMLIGATGKMKVYTIWSSSITVINIPLSWGLLSQGYNVYWVFIIRTGLNFVCAIIRPLYVRSLVETFSIRKFASNLLKPIIVSIILIVVFLLYYVLPLEVEPFIRIVLSFIFTLIVIWLFGLKRDEKQWLKSIIINKLLK